MPRRSLAVAALLLATGLAQATPPTTTRLPAPARGTDSAFALDMYRQLAAPHKNLFFSPHSLSVALAMTAEGARGETAQQMCKALHFGEPADLPSVHARFAELNKRLSKKAIGCEVDIANAVWLDKRTPMRQGYLDSIKKHYGSGVYGVDFRGDADGACRLINAWASKQTRGRIGDVVSPKANMRMVLANAIYFKGDWVEPFKKRDTRDEDFHLTKGATVHLPTMSKAGMGSVSYAAFEGDGTYFDTPQYSNQGDSDANCYPGENGFVLLEMPYKSGELSMVVVLPRSIGGLAAVEKSLTAEKLQGYIDKLVRRDVHVHVPKFEMHTEYDLNGPLQAMGMARAFVEPGRLGNGAQFDGMTETDDANEKLYIGQVRQKAFVEANEKGTEAAAVTTVLGLAGAAPPIGPVSHPFTPTFRADRPFAFLIRDRKTGTLLFLGRVCDPRAKG